MKTRRVPSQHCRDARVNGQTATAMHDERIQPPSSPRKYINSVWVVTCPPYWLVRVSFVVPKVAISTTHRNPLYGYPSVHGAVFRSRESYGPVRCSFRKLEIIRCGSVRFSDIVTHTVQCGAGMYPTVRFGAGVYPMVRFGGVLKNMKSYGADRCGFEK